MVVAVLVLSWTVLMKKELVAPVRVPVADDGNGEIIPDDIIPDDDIFDDMKDSQIFSVSKSEFKVLDKFNALELKNKSKDCGTDKSEQYFKELLSYYSENDNGIEYQFKYQGQTQSSGVWIITAISNKVGYTNLEDFKNDFNLCEAGSNRYPYLISEKYILFASSCGTGYDDNSKLSHGCDIVRKMVEPMIKINGNKNNDISKVDTSDWKTYRNEELGFEIKYPDDLEMDDSESDRLHELYNSKSIVWFSKMLCCKFSFENGMTMETYYSIDKSKYPDLNDLFKSERKGFGEESFSVEKYGYKNFEGVKIISTYSETCKEEYIELFLKTDGGFYYFSWYVNDPENRGFTYTNYFIPMLSTFKFTEE